MANGVREIVNPLVGVEDGRKSYDTDTFIAKMSNRVSFESAKLTPFITA